MLFWLGVENNQSIFDRVVKNLPEFDREDKKSHLCSHLVPVDSRIIAT